MARRIIVCKTHQGGVKKIMQGSPALLGDGGAVAGLTGINQHEAGSLDLWIVRGFCGIYEWLYRHGPL